MPHACHPLPNEVKNTSVTIYKLSQVDQVHGRIYLLQRPPPALNATPAVAAQPNRQLRAAVTRKAQIQRYPKIHQPRSCSDNHTRRCSCRAPGPAGRGRCGALFLQLQLAGSPVRVGGSAAVPRNRAPNNFLQDCSPMQTAGASPQLHHSACLLVLFRSMRCLFVSSVHARAETKNCAAGRWRAIEQGGRRQA
jgi:hypothetical protein